MNTRATRVTTARLGYQLRTLAISLLIGLEATLQLAQTPALGPEFQVNAYSSGIAAGTPSVAIDASGNFVVVWDSNMYGAGVRGQRYDSAGAPQGEEFPIDENTGGTQFGPDVGMDAIGNFVVVFNFEGDIFGRRFNNGGTPQGDAFVVNADTTGGQYFPSVAMNASGDFVVVWNDDVEPGLRVFAQRFNSAGQPQGPEFQVDTDSTHGDFPDVVMDSAGEFVVVWTGYDKVFARRYDSGGVPQGDPVAIVQNPDLQGSGSVAMNPSGAMIVTWWRYAGIGTDVFARRFDATGAPQGDEFRVNSYTPAQVQDSQPKVAINDSGDFVVAWTSAQDGDDSYGIFGQRYDSKGRRIGSEFELNMFTSRAQEEPSVALDGAGHFVVAWKNYSYDGSFSQVSARRGDLHAALPMKVDTHASPATSSNVNGVLEPGESIQVEPAWMNTFAGTAWLLGTASDIAGPAGTVASIDDASADYGPVAPGSMADCYAATPAQDCYVITVSGVRPSQHWDVSFLENIIGFAGPLTKTWTLHLGESFPDVPTSEGSYAYIENIFHNGITSGCGGGNFCPGLPVSRGQIAVLLLKVVHGSDYTPPPCVGVFSDVPCPSPNADWIEQLYHEGTTGGCGGDAYCPNAPVARGQMAVLLLKTQNGSNYFPPTCSGVFPDVPCPGTFADWVEELYREDITGGCGDGNYCPSNPTTRAQMAVLFVKTFGLLLYGP